MSFGFARVSEVRHILLSHYHNWPLPPQRLKWRSYLPGLSPSVFACSPRSVFVSGRSVYRPLAGRPLRAARGGRCPAPRSDSAPSSSSSPDWTVNSSNSSPAKHAIKPVNCDHCVLRSFMFYSFVLRVPCFTTTDYNTRLDKFLSSKNTRIEMTIAYKEWFFHVIETEKYTQKAAVDVDSLDIGSWRLMSRNPIQQQDVLIMDIHLTSVSFWSRLVRIIWDRACNEFSYNDHISIRQNRWQQC